MKTSTRLHSFRLPFALRFARRTATALAVATLGVSLGLPVANAQGPMGGGPGMPLGIDLAKAPLGSWAEYRMEMPGAAAALKQRLALVGRDPNGHVVEMRIEGGPIPGGGPVTVKIVVDPDNGKSDRVRKVIMQMGDQDPMEMPVNPQMQQGQFTPVDPKKLVGTETIKVPAGEIKAKHYRDQRPGAPPMDAWISEDVPPFGLVKVETIGQGPGVPPGSKVSMVLIAKGTGAKPSITKPAKPFDQMALMRAFQAGSGAQHAGPPPGAPPTGATTANTPPSGAPAANAAPGESAPAAPPADAPKGKGKGKGSKAAAPKAKPTTGTPPAKAN